VLDWRLCLYFQYCISVPNFTGRRRPITAVAQYACHASIARLESQPALSPACPLTLHSSPTSRRTPCTAERREAKSWEQAALLRHEASNALLSSMLHDSRPEVAKDVTRALKLAAAEVAMGCAHSKGALGRCHAAGVGIAKDVAKGLALARESAAAGSCFGQFVVGKCCDAGWGVALDHANAVRWYRLSPAQGSALARCDLN
jgi:TPR repeat protein